MSDVPPSRELQLSSQDAAKILAMIARGDRRHDIAAWFGVDQERIAGVERGDYGTPRKIYEGDELFPSGPPGIKVRRLISTVDELLNLLRREGSKGIDKAVELLQEARQRYGHWE